MFLTESKKFDYGTPEWMNKSITLSLKKRSKLTSRYQNKPLSYNQEALLNQARECTAFTKAKERHIAKMSAKADNPETAQKTYWSIINKFLNTKNVFFIPPTLLVAS